MRSSVLLVCGLAVGCGEAGTGNRTASPVVAPDAAAVREADAKAAEIERQNKAAEAKALRGKQIDQ